MSNGVNNDVIFAKNADFTQVNNVSVSDSNGLFTDGQLWIGATAVNVGGTHINVGTITSPLGTLTVGYSSPNITLDLAGGSMGIDSITPNSGTNPVVPDVSGNVSIVGTGSITSVGSLNTLTLELTGLTNHAVLIGAGTSTITKVGPVASTGAILQSNGVGSDPGFSTATYPSTSTINQLLYSSAANTITGLATANSSLAATNSSGTLAMRALSTVIQTFTVAGTYTPTTGMLYCIIEVVGNGGGGGGVAATTGGTFAGAGGGGGGEYARGVFSAATIGVTQTITFGATGTGGAAGANAGTSGGTVAVGALISSAGGTGGVGGGASTSTSSLGGAGGTGGSGGSFRSPGFIGSPSITSVGGAFLIGGMGGDSFFGAGANCSNVSAAGTSGLGYGSGGSGAVNGVSQAARAGGNGSTGIVVVTEYVIA